MEAASKEDTAFDMDSFLGIFSEEEAKPEPKPQPLQLREQPAAPESPQRPVLTQEPPKKTAPVVIATPVSQPSRSRAESVFAPSEPVQPRTSLSTPTPRPRPRSVSSAPKPTEFRPAEIDDKSPLLPMKASTGASKKRKRLFGSSARLREAFILKEILDKPVSLNRPD